jgi:hypothetical protein
MEEENKKSKVWLGDDGIIRIKIEKVMNMEIAKTLVQEMKDIAKELSPKVKVLVDVNNAPSVASSIFRREMVELIIDLFKNNILEKVALWGGEIIMRTSLSFILRASRIKNIKYFKAEEEALKWLKEE